MKCVFIEQHCCEHSLLWLLGRMSEEALGWVGQTLDLGWAAHQAWNPGVQHSQGPPKDVQPRKVVIVPFPISGQVPSSGLHALCEHLPKEKNEELMNTGQIQAQPFGRKKHKPHWSQRMGGRRPIICRCWKTVLQSFWAEFHILWDTPENGLTPPQRWSLPQPAMLPSPESTHHGSGNWRINMK